MALRWKSICDHGISLAGRPPSFRLHQRTWTGAGFRAGGNTDYVSPQRWPLSPLWRRTSCLAAAGRRDQEARLHGGRDERLRAIRVRPRRQTHRIRQRAAVLAEGPGPLGGSSGNHSLDRTPRRCCHRKVQRGAHGRPGHEGTIVDATHYYVKRKSDNSIKEIKDLNGQILGVQAGSGLLQRVPELEAMLAKIIEYTSYPEAYQDRSCRSCLGSRSQPLGRGSTCHQARR
jgi:hypothetical protein